MMNEPLKGKLYSFEFIEDWIKDTSKENYKKCAKLNVLLRKNDVSSAVRWLKGYVDEQDNEGNVYFDYEQLCNMIDEAFEDLTKEKEIKEIKKMKINQMSKRESDYILLVWKLWEKDFFNAKKFFESKGNVETRFPLKKKWHDEFVKSLKEGGV